MKSLEELRQQARHQQQQLEQLQRATNQLEAAQQERIWAIASVRRAGLFYRQILAITRLASPTFTNFCKVLRLITSQLG